MLKFKEAAKWDARIICGHEKSIWLCIPELPPSLNAWSRMHWRVRHSLVKEMERNLSLLVLAFNMPLIERAEV